MTAKQNLLIVDENPYVAGILSQTLQTDFTVTVVNTGQDALDLLTQGNRFDCVLTELNLPNVGGLALTQFIRTSRAIHHTPVVVLSDAADSDTRIRCLEQGVDGYVAKPFNPLEVKARLRAVLRRTSLPVEAPQPRSLPVRLTPTGTLTRSGQLKSRILSIFQREYNLSQSA